jgi:hypothetical protein
VSGDSGDEEGKRKREQALIVDYLQERDELSQGPRFHVPPFTIKRIEGTRTIYYAPIGEDAEEQLEHMRQGQPGSEKRSADEQAPRPSPEVLPGVLPPHGAVGLAVPPLGRGPAAAGPGEIRRAPAGPTRLTAWQRGVTR